MTNKFLRLRHINFREREMKRDRLLGSHIFDRLLLIVPFALGILVMPTVNRDYLKPEQGELFFTVSDVGVNLPSIVIGG